jgi:hypothetical protein
MDHPVEVTMRRIVLAALIVMAMAVPARGQVHVDIGIHLPGPPALAVVPGVPVYYAPHASANVFFYGHQYWLFHRGAWFAGPTWSGPWVVVEPIHLPVPILHVPVRYYHVRPTHWHGWRHDVAPRWDGHWGREWREATHERDWREREERWSHKHDNKHDRDHRGRGHRK